MQDFFTDKTVAQIVRENYRTADVFKRYGINYCCGGAVSLNEACRLRGVMPEELGTELEKVFQKIHLPFNLQYNKWKLDFLGEYITNVHHAYLKESLPKLEANLLPFVNGHQKKYPCLNDLLLRFQQLRTLLQTEMKLQEEVLFPYIKQLEAAHRNRETYGSLFVKTLRKPLQKNNEENAGAKTILESLRELTNNYRFSNEACTAHRVVYQQLQELDNDLQQHKHLENNILFPRAIEMETGLLQLSDRR